MKKNSLKLIAPIIEYMRPHSIIGYQKTRIGGKNDGGYVCIDDFKNIDLAISGGVFDDDRWETEISREKNIPTIAFDPCIFKDTSNLDYKIFAGKLEAYPKTNNSILDVVLLNYNKNQVIGKIDIEGDEWNLLKFTTDETLTKFRQLVIEFHLNSPEKLIETAGIFEKMYKHFRVVHIHGNNCDHVFKFQNFIMPKVFEITFANINYYNMEISNEVFPTELDMPNCPENKEIYLGTFSL